MNFLTGCDFFNKLLFYQRGLTSLKGHSFDELWFFSKGCDSSMNCDFFNILWVFERIVTSQKSHDFSEKKQKILVHTIDC